jgi:hypothetical protein
MRRRLLCIGAKLKLMHVTWRQPCLQHPAAPHRSSSSPLCFCVSLFAEKSLRACSTAFLSAGVPASGSYTHTWRPLWSFNVRKRGLLSGSPALTNLHIFPDYGVSLLC